MTVSPFVYTSGNPDQLVGGQPAVMTDIQGPFYDLRAYLNALGPLIDAASPSAQALTATPVLDVGLINQIRAGRQLTLADFTALGLSTPLGLWNLSDLTNLGSGGALSNKGSVPFGVGINGIAGTAAVFAGSTAQALYIPDTGAADPFRIRTGSFGCWFRTAKRGTAQGLIGKRSAAAGQYAWWLAVDSTNVAQVVGTLDGTTLLSLNAVSDIADDRWHFAVATHDGTQLRAYVDGALEATGTLTGPVFAGSGPLNIGGLSADSGAVAVAPHYGRVDEAFVTPDVLSDDQIRALYCTKIPFSYSTTPSRITLNVRRRRRGGPLAVTDFPTQPGRLHNFTAGSLADEGTGGIALTNNGTALSVAGADGAPGGAFSFAGTNNLMATDAGLPSGTATRSYGCWFKTTSLFFMGVMGWGNTTTTWAMLHMQADGGLTSYSGTDAISAGFRADGQWHFAVVTEDNAAGDGVRRKLYVDGRLAAGSTVLNAITLGGANKFRIGSNVDGGSILNGQVDGAFVTGTALTAADVAALYAKGSQALAASPKNVGDHIEYADATNLYATFDSLDSTAQIDLGVTA